MPSLIAITLIHIEARGQQGIAGSQQSPLISASKEHRSISVNTSSQQKTALKSRKPPA
jgi:hypothetical protein